MRVRLALILLVLGALPAAADDLYSVYFQPDPAYAPQRVNLSGGYADIRYAIVYNLTAKPVTPGAHSYKLLLRVAPPSGPIVCEATAIVQPWEGKYTIKKVAYFEAIYKRAKLPPNRVPERSSGPATGKYRLYAYLTEQIPPGQSAQETDTSNNQYPFAGSTMAVELDVRAGVDEVKCGTVASLIREALGDLKPKIKP